MVTYNPTKDKVYALLKDQAKSDDIIKAAFHVSICFKLRVIGIVCILVSYPYTQCVSAAQAHVLLHFINASHARRLKQKQKQANPDRSEHLYSRNMDFLAHIAESCKIVSSSYGTFKKKAREQVKTPYLYDKCTCPLYM
jgi:hypothetical protein